MRNLEGFKTHEREWLTDYSIRARREYELLMDNNASLCSSICDEDIRKNVTAISYYEDCGRDGQRKLSFENREDRFWVNVYDSACHDHQKSTMQREMSSEEWKGLLDRLYGKVNLHEWEHRFCNPHICDGRVWNLKVYYGDGQVQEYSGQNAYPPYWKDLCATLRPFYLEFDIFW